MKCPRCGKEMDARDRACENCGDPNPNYNEPSSGVSTNSYAPTHIPEGVLNNPPRQRSKVADVLLAISKALLYVIIFFGCQLLVMEIYTVIAATQINLTSFDQAELQKYTEQILTKLMTEDYLLFVLVSNLVTLLAVCLLQTVRRKSLTDELSVKSINIMRIPSFALYGLVLNAIVVCLYALLPIDPELLESLDSQYAPMYEQTSVAVQILTVAVIVPIVEEVLFRGLILSRLRRGLGSVLSVILSAAIFALFHGTVLAVIYAFVLGIILGIMTLKYDSIVPAVLCHMFYNFASYILELFGNVPVGIVLMIAVLAAVYLTYSIFISRPTLTDIVVDKRGVVKPKNAAEAELIAKVHALREKSEVTRADVEALNNEWNRLASRRAEKRTNDINDENENKF